MNRWYREERAGRIMRAAIVVAQAAAVVVQLIEELIKFPW